MVSLLKPVMIQHLFIAQPHVTLSTSIASLEGVRDFQQSSSLFNSVYFRNLSLKLEIFTVANAYRDNYGSLKLTLSKKVLFIKTSLTFPY